MIPLFPALKPEGNIISLRGRKVFHWTQLSPLISLLFLRITRVTIMKKLQEMPSSSLTREMPVEKSNLTK